MIKLHTVTPLLNLIPDSIVPVFYVNRVCAWCCKPMPINRVAMERDTISHGMCDPCAEIMEADLESIFDEKAA